jgi:ankyrin repeat protein
MASHALLTGRHQVASGDYGMNWKNRTILLAIAVSLAAPATAQIGGGGGYDGQQFVEAVRKGDNDKALDLLKKEPNLVNARDGAGRTALVSAIEAKQRDWTGQLLNSDADPNLANPDGETPLIAAAKVGFNEAANWLINLGAKVDTADRSGETALIFAVQTRNLPLVKLLLDHGADPDKTDNVQGYSARDYARRDNRSPEILRAIEAKKPAS